MGVQFLDNDLPTCPSAYLPLLLHSSTSRLHLEAETTGRHYGRKQKRTFWHSVPGRPEVPCPTLPILANNTLFVKYQRSQPAIPHPRLEVREIVSLGAPEAVGQIRIGFVGGGRAGKYPR